MTAIPESVKNAGQIVEVKDINTSPDDGKSGYSEEDAARIVIQQSETDKAWLEQYYFTTRWLLADVLYQSPPTFKNWEGSNIPRSFYRPFTIATHVNSIKNKLITGLFYEEEPFSLQTRSGADNNTIRAIKEVLGAQLDMGNFRQEVKLGIHSALLFGTAIWKWDFYTCEETRWEFKRNDKPIEIKTPDPQKSLRLPTVGSDRFTKVPVTKTVSYPRLKNVDNRHCRVSSNTLVPDIQQAPHVIHEMEKTFRDLQKLAGEVYIDGITGKEAKRYNLPSEEQFKLWFAPPVDVSAPSSVESYQMNTNYVHHAAPRFQATSADPLEVGLRVLEYWDKLKVITVICGEVSGGYVIRNEANPFGEIPFYSVNWWDIGDAFWGLGLGVTLSSDQLLQQGIKNGLIDIVTLALNGPLLHARGANINTQQLRARLGGFVAADIPAGAHSVGDAITQFPLPKFPAESMSLLGMSESDTESTSGANEQLTLGGTPSKGRTSLGRTATGAGGMMAAAEGRLAGFIEDLNRNMFQRWLWKMHELNCHFLPLESLRDLLAEELGEAFKIDEEKFLNSPYDGSIKEFKVLAGSHIAVNQKIAQWLPISIQYLLNPNLKQQENAMGNDISIDEIVHMMFDVSGASGSYYSVIKKLSAEAKQALTNNNPALLKAQSQAAAQKQKTEDKKELIHEQGTVDTAKALMIKHADQQNQEHVERAEGTLDRSSITAAGQAEAVTGAPNLNQPGFGGALG